MKKAILTAFLMLFVLSAQSLPQKQLDELNLKIDAVENKMDVHIHSLEGQIEELKEVFEGQMEKLKQTMEEKMANLGTTSPDTTTSPKATKAIVVSGGHNAEKSVEVFIPGVGACKLPDLPYGRTAHIMETIDDKPVICFGFIEPPPGVHIDVIQYGCLQLTPIVSSGRNFGIWQDSRIMDPWGYDGPRPGGQNRGSWVSSAGLVVLDTREAQILNTTKTIEIRYPKYACIITDKDSIIVTGGEDNQGVARYNLKGLVEHLPSLSQQRRYHGCGSYHSSGSMELIVAGGWRGSDKLSTTEKLTIGNSYWTTVKGLPRTLGFMGSVSMDNKVFLIGGYTGNKGDYRQEILAFDGEEWKEVGQLQNGRSSPAVTVVDADFAKFCI